MTLLRLVQRASILAGMTFASLSLHSISVRADNPQICVIANNSKTVCGTLKTGERACVTTDGSNSICGKFKSATEGQPEAKQPTQGTVARKEVKNFVYTLKGCRKSGTNVKCELTITNNGGENFIGFWAGMSTFVDNDGKSYKGSTVDLGGASSSYQGDRMTPGINYSASITFENVPDRVVTAQLLNLKFSESVQFRNVSF